jgi:membrane protein DedA with SNARE-associated domain
MTVEEVIAQFDAWMATLGPWAGPAIGASGFVEYIAPPFPGDTLVVIGGAAAARGHVGCGVVYICLLLSSAFGTLALWAIGHRLAPRLSSWPRVEKWLTPGLQSMARRGVVVLLVHRFLPTLHTVLIVAAGAAGMSLRTTLSCALVSAALWNAVLLCVGATVGKNAAAIGAFLSAYQRVAFACIAAAVVVWLVARLRSRRLRSPV